MFMNKKYMIFALLFLVVGFATISTTILFNGTASISESKDFKVYFSRALVNGVEDKSIIDSATSLTFYTELSGIGQSFELEYDVTNGSKNYDANINLTCTDGNEYISVENVFDTTKILSALETRTGVFTAEMIRSFVGDSLQVEVKCTFSVDAVERTELAEGEAPAPLEKPDAKTYQIGEEVMLVDEKFYVVDQTKATLYLLAEHNLGTNYKQTSTLNGVSFADNKGWEYYPGPKEISYRAHNGNAKNYLLTYVENIENQTGYSIDGDLITLKQLQKLGCTITKDYSYSDEVTCVNSDYKDWLITGYNWWTKSASSDEDYLVWRVSGDGSLIDYGYANTYGIRPIIIIDKDYLEE